MSGSSRARTILYTAAVAVAVLMVAPISIAQLSVDTTPLGLGKVDPGHSSVHAHTVTNQADQPTTVKVQVECPCTTYVTATPTEFVLQPGQSQDLTITVDVPLDADPGIHDNVVRVIAMSETSSGGVAQSASAIGASFQVRTAKVYLDPVTGPQHISTRFVNAYDGPLEVTYEGTITTPSGTQRHLGPFTRQADGSGAGSHVSRLDLPLGLDDKDVEQGIHRVDLNATWSDTSGQIVGTQDLDAVEVAIGAMVRLTDTQVDREGSVITARGLVTNLGSITTEVHLVATIRDTEDRERTIEGLPVQVEPGKTKDIAARWADADPERHYKISMHAVYAGSAIQSGKTGGSDMWDLTPGDTDLDEGAEPAGETSSRGTSGGRGYTIVGIVALVGIGVGAAVGILVNRTGRDP